MKKNESIEKLEKYFSSCKKREELEEQKKSDLLTEIRESISFKSKAQMRTFVKKRSSNKVEIIYYPLDIENIKEKLKNNYEVVYDNTSKKFYEVISMCEYGSYKCKLYEYMVLLPKRDTLKPIGVVVLRECLHDLLYYYLTTGIDKEISHGIYVNEINYFTNFADFRPTKSSYYKLEDTHIDNDVCYEYIKEKMLNTRVRISLNGTTDLDSIKFNLISEQIVEETVGILNELDIDELYENDIYLTKTSHIIVTGKKYIECVDCNVYELDNNRYIGCIKQDIFITKININYILKDKEYKDEYIHYKDFSVEGFLSEFIS